MKTPEQARTLTENLAGQTFVTWMNRVDAVIAQHCGLSHVDLADQTWHEWWEEDMTPADAAETALADEGFPFEEE